MSSKGDKPGSGPGRYIVVDGGRAPGRKPPSSQRPALIVPAGPGGAGGRVVDEGGDGARAASDSSAPPPDPNETTTMDPDAGDERTRVVEDEKASVSASGARKRPAFPPREEMPTVQWKRGEEHKLGLPPRDPALDDEEEPRRGGPLATAMMERSPTIIVDGAGSEGPRDSLAETMLPPEGRESPAPAEPPARRGGSAASRGGPGAVTVGRSAPAPRRFDQAPEDLVILAAPDSQAAAQFRVLRFKLEERPAIRSVVVTSPQEGEGKTITALNLALAMAEGGKRRVALVEGDLRTPRLADLVGLSQGAPGVTELIAERKMMPDEPLRLYPIVRGLELLPAGQPTDNPASVLGSAQLAQVFEELLGFYHYIIVDTPPVLRYADANLVQALVDAIIVVARTGVSRTDMVSRAMARLPRQKILGTILTGVDVKTLATK